MLISKESLDNLFLFIDDLYRNELLLLVSRSTSSWFGLAICSRLIICLWINLHGTDICTSKSGWMLFNNHFFALNLTCLNRVGYQVTRYFLMQGDCSTRFGSYFFYLLMSYCHDRTWRHARHWCCDKDRLLFITMSILGRLVYQIGWGRLLL